MKRIKKLGKLKINRLTAILLIKNELGFCLKSAKDFFDKLIDTDFYLDEEMENYWFKTLDKIFDNIEYFPEETEDSYCMDLSSSKYWSIEYEELIKKTEYWYENLSDEDKKFADMYVEINSIRMPTVT